MKQKYTVSATTTIGQEQLKLADINKFLDFYKDLLENFRKKIKII